MDKLNFGIVGIGGRPSVFLSAFNISGRARLAAVCDLNQEAMEKAVAGFSDTKIYTDYREMLEKADLDAVIIGTPMPLHASQSIAALEKNINVFSEVTAAVNIDECKNLLEACKSSKAQYMMGENCNYMKPYMIIHEMVRDGMFGEVFYAEGEYLHDCRFLWDKTPWRRELKKKGGVTYGTHSLGPVLSWFEGDRVTRVCCIGSGQHNLDLHGNPIVGEDGYVMLCKTKKDRLIKVRYDTTSPHPYNLKYTLQGTKGAYEGSRMEKNTDKNLIWLEGSSEKDIWDELSRFAKKYTPKLWSDYGPKVEVSGHGGSDVLIMIDFIDALYEGRNVPIDIHASLDLTLPGLVSQYSVMQNGGWQEVPDSRNW